MAEPKRFFLHVERSARNMGWTHRLDLRSENEAIAIAQDHDTGDLLARVLAGRGIASPDVPDYLEPTLKQLLPDPRTLTDMEAAAGRIADAVRRRERIGIFGDYDVDGASSSALLVRYFRHFGMETDVHIPDRVFEGYGPNAEAMTALARKASLIVTVDCGTNSAEPIAAAKAAGADVVVLDHHQVSGTVPPDALATVNPNRDDDLSGQGHLCAAGIVFLTLVETSRQLRERATVGLPDLMALTDLVALATVCDVVPLTGVNRAFVRRGLSVARQMHNPGIAALAAVSRIGEPLNPYHFGFMIGPRINAGGRIGNAALGSQLLACDDPAEAQAIAENLDRLNSERQAMEQTMLAEAEAAALAEFGSAEPPPVIVTGSENWHPGIVGLIAARLKERLQRPSFAISFDGRGVGTGSGRSISGFDLGRIVRDAVDAGLLVKGGGHAMAAGLTVEREKLGPLRAFFEERASASVGRLVEGETLKIDAALVAEAVNLDLVERLERAGPFGSGNPQPVFVLPQHRLTDAMEVGRGHLRLSLRSPSGGRLDAMAFRAADAPLGAFLHKSRGSAIHLAGTIGANHFNGRTYAQFRVIDAAPA